MSVELRIDDPEGAPIGEVGVYHQLAGPGDIAGIEPEMIAASKPAPDSRAALPWRGRGAGFSAGSGASGSGDRGSTLGSAPRLSM